MSQELGNGYYARPLQESDLNGPYMSWFRDQEVCRFNSHGKFAKTESEFRDYVARINRGDTVVWAVCHVDDGHIGNVSLQEFSFINRSAEFAVIMGNRAHWGKGAARAAALALVSHGFTKLNLNRIGCGTAATNTGMIRLAAALRMREEGRRRSALFLEGAWVDLVEFGVLREEFLT